MIGIPIMIKDKNEDIYRWWMIDGWKNIWGDGWDVWGWCCMLADDEYIHKNYDI